MASTARAVLDLYNPTQLEQLRPITKASAILTYTLRPPATEGAVPHAADRLIWTVVLHVSHPSLATAHGNGRNTARDPVRDRHFLRACLSSIASMLWVLSRVPCGATGMS